MNRFLSQCFLVLLSSLLFLPVAAASDQAFYYQFPASSEVLIQGDSRKVSEARMDFQENFEEWLQVPAGQKGIVVANQYLEVHVKEESKLLVSSPLDLEYGSIYVRTKENGEYELLVGDLLVKTRGAEFLLYRSRSGTETVVKMLSQGEVTVVSSKTDQETTLKPYQASSADAEARLVIPYEIEEPKEAWWLEESYDFDGEWLPISNAGADQRVLGNISVMLNGSKSDFKTGDIFEWTLESAPSDSNGKPITQVAFDSTNIVKPLFTPETEGVYTFSLQITDTEGRKSNVDNVSIYVGKDYLRPVAIFPDVPAEHPNNIAITYLYKKDVMRGSEDPESGEVVFRPDDIVNRVEILKTVFENKGKAIPSVDELKEEEIFEDVKAEHWFAPYVYLAKEEGIVKGNDGLYRPADGVVLVEALKIITEAYDMSMESFGKIEGLPFPDAEEGAWYNPYLHFLRKYNLLDGDEQGNIIPARPLKRAELAEIMYRMESVNLFEKRGYLNGRLRDLETGAGIPNAQVFIYKALADSSKEGGFKKGDLYFKTDTNADGSFGVSLPVLTKYYIEAITESNASVNKVITEVEEDKTKNVDLEIRRSQS